MLDESRIRFVVDELDRAIPREKAVVHLEQYGGGPDESEMIANRLGFLRLGIELLKAGIDAKPCLPRQRVSVDIRYLIDESSTVGFDALIRDDSLPARETSTTVGQDIFGYLLALGLSSVLIGILFLAIIGSCALIRGF